MTIIKLKERERERERVKSLNGDLKEDKIKKELEIETINIELDHRVTKLIAENEHLKQTYKQLYESIKLARIRSKEQCDDLINQVNLKSVENSDLNASLQEKVLDIYAAGFENRPPMLNKENYVPWLSRLLQYAKSRPNGKLIHNSIINCPYVRRMIPEPGDPNREVPVNETFHEIWVRVRPMMKGSDIGIQEKKVKLFNEWERFTSTNGESIESYYHRFLKLMNDLKRNKHFPKKTASNLKFLNNLQLEWSRHVTIFHQTNDLHTADYTQLYDFLKYNQKVVDDLKAERLAKTQDPLALMATSNNPYAIPVLHQDQPSFN
nr:hypothetical protein [Tanacetum cinerariifolium]